MLFLELSISASYKLTLQKYLFDRRIDGSWLHSLCITFIIKTLLTHPKGLQSGMSFKLKILRFSSTLSTKCIGAWVSDQKVLSRTQTYNDTSNLQALYSRLCSLVTADVVADVSVLTLCLELVNLFRALLLHLWLWFLCIFSSYQGNISFLNRPTVHCYCLSKQF